MRETTIKEIRELANYCREDVWDAAQDEPKIYLHWSAGHYNSKFDDYHINITGDGKLWLATDDFSEKLAHTWRRNSGAVGISLCCCYGATTNGLGNEPPTAKQIEMMAQAIVAVADGLWLTIDKKHVMTHGEAADSEDGVYTWSADDCYGPRTTCERWDLEFLETEESPSFNPWATDGSRGGDVLRGKANWYRNAWKDK